uniref:Uncharacterized protein n=1 Tax=Opuntia streptacantha TaxID=393608 RepID=A0A7C9ELV9_OPUST
MERSLRNNVIFTESLTLTTPNSSVICSSTADVPHHHRGVVAPSSKYASIRGHCNNANHIFMMSDALHHSSINKRHHLKTIVPVSTGYQKIFRWCLQSGKALCSKYDIFCQCTPNLTRWKNISTNSKKGVL